MSDSVRQMGCIYLVFLRTRPSAGGDHCSAAAINDSRSGSTDVGDVSYCAPTAQIRVATTAIGTPGHSWQKTGQGAVNYCHKGVVTAAKVIALTALKAIDNPEIIEKAKAEHKKNCPDGYICPTDPDFMPALEG